MKAHTLEPLSARFTLVLCALTYSIIVGVLYHAVVMVFHTVQGYVYHETTVWYFLLSCLLSALPVVYLPVRSHRVSSSILWFLFFVFYIPSVVIPQYIMVHDGISVLIWMLLLFIGFSLAVIGHYLPIFKLPKLVLSYNNYFIFLFICWFVFVIYLYMIFGLSLDFSALDDVYGQRAEFIEKISASGSVVLGYVVILSGYWLAPVMLLSGLCYLNLKLRRGWLLIFMAASLIAYIYIIAAYKSIALSFLVVFCFAKLMKIKGQASFKIFFSIMVLISVSWLVSGISGYDFIAHHLIRRSILTPGMNATYFYDYFSRSLELNGLSPAHAVSQYYYGTNGSANAGFLAAGYASLGSLGIIIIGFAMAIALWGANIVTKGMPFAFVAAAFLMQTYAFANSAFGTVMISYGFVATIITLYLCPFRVSVYHKTWPGKQ